MNKSDCRKVIKEKIILLSKKQKLNFSSIICDKVSKLDCIKNAKVVMCYRNNEDEVNVDLLSLYLQKNNKLVCFPKTINNQIIALYPRDNQFIRGDFDILEPDVSSSVQIEKDAIDVVIVPLVGFDKKCHRLGHGKGYYDRFLSNYKGYKIGVAFKHQRLNEIPIDDNDVTLDMVVTENWKYKR